MWRGLAAQADVVGPSKESAHMPLRCVARGWPCGGKGRCVVLRLPHGGGKHGRNAAEADKGRRHSMALCALRAQHGGTRLRRCGQGRPAQAGK